MRQFVENLHSGKLHDDFHKEQNRKAAKTSKTTKSSKEPKTKSDSKNPQKPKNKSHDEIKPIEQPVAVPESVFRNLQPSKERYSIKKEEF